MELRHLRYFLVVAEEGHFTRAAQRLGMQQPPLSQQIRALEKELGFALFRRHPKGAALTVGGEAFLKEATAILHGVEQAAERAARAAEGAEGNISVGCTSSAAAHPLIPKIVQAFRVAYPAVHLDFREGSAAELTEEIERRKLDIAFLRLPVSKPPMLAFHRLAEEEMLLVLPVDHHLLAGRSGDEMPSIPLKALAQERFILVRRYGAPGMYSNLIDACERAGFTPQIALEVERMLPNISLVAAGVGISAVPASMKGFHRESVVYCHIRGERKTLAAPLTMSHWKTDISPAVENFLGLAKAVVRRSRA